MTQDGHELLAVDLFMVVFAYNAHSIHTMHFIADKIDFVKHYFRGAAVQAFDGRRPWIHRRHIVIMPGVSLRSGSISVSYRYPVLKQSL